MSKSNLRHRKIQFLILIPWLLIIPPQVVADPADDLSVSFRGDRDRLPYGGIAGKVTNRSARTYECVDLVFRLIYKEGHSGPAEQWVRVRDVAGRHVVKYSAPLQTPAGFGLDDIKNCGAVVDPSPTPQREAKDCNVVGSIHSTIGFRGIDDTGQQRRIDKVFLLTPDGKLVSEAPLSRKVVKVNDHRTKRKYEAREFDFPRLPEGFTYKLTLSHAWRTEPQSTTFTCPDRKGRHDFRVAPFEHVGNRLGG